MSDSVHVSFERLIDYLEGKLSEPDRRAVEEHLATGCPACDAELAWIGRLIALMRTDELVDPPKEVIERACALYSKMRQQSGASAHRELEAVLVYDSHSSLQPAGVRTMGGEVRQLLYRAEDVDIDLQMRELERPGSIDILGQVLPLAGEAGDLAFQSVRLMRGDEEVGSTFTNGIGEFAFEEVEEATYGIGLQLKMGCVNIRDVSL